MKKKPVRAPAMNPHELLAADIRREVLTSPMLNSARQDEIRMLKLRVRELEQELERLRDRTKENFISLNAKLKSLQKNNSRFLLTPSRRRRSMR